MFAELRALLLFRQVKIELPVHMHEKHHILFTFYHISCESSSKASSKKREGVESLGERAKIVYILESIILF